MLLTFAALQPLWAAAALTMVPVGGVLRWRYQVQICGVGRRTSRSGLHWS
jgi:hypothetical protein